MKTMNSHYFLSTGWGKKDICICDYNPKKNKKCFNSKWKGNKPTKQELLPQGTNQEPPKLDLWNGEHNNKPKKKNSHVKEQRTYKNHYFMPSITLLMRASTEQVPYSTRERERETKQTQDTTGINKFQLQTNSPFAEWLHSQQL